MIYRNIGSPPDVTYIADAGLHVALRRERFSVWAAIFPEVT